jgi:hypothetical protein
MISNTNLDMFATGSCVCGYGKRDQDEYDQLYGTSQATPIVASAAAILADEHPDWDAQHVKWRLISTTDLQDDLYKNGKGGALNFRAAMDYRSVLERAPRSLLETAQDYLSKNTTKVEILSVDKNSGGWAKLLDGVTQVLRVHRVKSCEKGYSCFRRILFQAGDADSIVPIENSATLPYTDKNNQRVDDLRAEDLVDAWFIFGV